MQPRQSFSNVEVIRRCVLANMGIGVLPRCVVDDDIASGNLRQQAIDSDPCLFTSRLIYPQRRAGSALLMALSLAITEVRTS